jgi:hypothetical protein
LYEAGIANGLGKPVLLVTTRARPLPLEQTYFSLAKVRLENRSALAFQLDVFLAVPHQDIFSRDAEYQSAAPSPPPPKPRSEAPGGFHGPESDLERRVYQIVEASGGTVQAQPHPPSGSKFRPDFLVWLGQQESELLDPAVIEVKGYVDSNDVRKFEQQLLSFMEAAGVRTGLVVTAGPVPPREQQLSVNVFWLDVRAGAIIPH